VFSNEIKKSCRAGATALIFLELMSAAWRAINELRA
jgi:hypothetical protein